MEEDEGYTDVVADFYLSEEGTCANFKVQTDKIGYFKDKKCAQILLDTCVEMIMQYYTISESDFKLSELEGMH